MKIDKKLNKKEKELIQGCKREEKTALEEFGNFFRPRIFLIAKSYRKDEDEAEDLTQNILIKLLNLIKKHEIKKNLYAWVEKVAKNHCIDEYRKEHSKSALKLLQPIRYKNKGTCLVDLSKDHKAIAPGSKEYYKQTEEDESLFRNLEVEYKRNISPAIQKSLETSLEHIELLYKLREKMKLDYAKYYPVDRIIEIISNAKKKVNYVLGPISWQKIARYKFLTSIDHLEFSDNEEEDKKRREELREETKEELKDLKKQSFKIYVHKALNEMEETLYSMTFFDPLFNEMMPAMKRPYNSHYFGFVLNNFAMKVVIMNIKPPRLMFSIWTKAKGLRKGKYVDLRKIKLIFRYFKMKTKGTDKEFLFNSIDEYLLTFEAIRKSLYKKSPNDKFYKKLADYIYKNSFIYI